MNKTKTDLNIVAIIPARGGSKRVPRKNLLPLGGYPMIAYSIIHARRSRLVSEVYVSTDDDEIAAVSRSFGAKVIDRPGHLSGDEASSESALLHALDVLQSEGAADPDLVVFLQGTSPVRKPDDIDHAIEKLLSESADSLLAACENSRFIWAVNPESGQPHALNYNYQKRQREQDLPQQFRENGSIYIFRTDLLRRTGNRLGGKMSIYEMDYWSSFQVDTTEHAELIQWILKKPEYALAPRMPQPVELVVFDFDGVMTDNAVHISEDGSEAVTCSRSDGWGISLLRQAGIPMLVLSTEENAVVAARCKKLKLTAFQNVAEKGVFLERYFKENKIRPQNVIYLGNDMNDADCFTRVGLPVAVADAHPAVLPLVSHVLQKRGGHGAVRELCDLILFHKPGGVLEV